jgi:hypothetical protein
MSVDFEKYVREYLQKTGILGGWNENEFSPLMKEVKYVLLGGKLYKHDCNVIVDIDPEAASLYKAKIRRIIIHEFGREIRVLFSADYYLLL